MFDSCMKKRISCKYFAPKLSHHILAWLGQETPSSNNNV
jgi:hypothetical protein